MRTNRVVLDSPALDKHFGLQQRVEQLCVQELIPERPVERLVVAVFESWDLGDQNRNVKASPWTFRKKRCSDIPATNQESMSGAVDVVANPINRDRIAVVGWLWLFVEWLTVKCKLAIRTSKLQSRPLLFE